MGLDLFSDDGKVEIFHGAYPAFSRWRAEIARLHGAKEYAWMYGPHKWDLTKTEDRAQSELHCKYYLKPDEHEAFHTEWKQIEGKQPALFALISHPDDSGSWTPEECKQVLTCLEPILEKLPKEDDWGHIGNWKATTQKFIDGLKYCVAHEQRAVFG
jgi:hypothetical protein